MHWKANYTTRFRKGYRKKSKSLQARADDAIRALLSTVNPEFLGKSKETPFKGCFAYELDRRNRILYMVNRHDKTIDFLRTCSHKEAYGP